MTSKSPATLEQDTRSPSKNSVRATVTGVDSKEQLFRDNARVILLKGKTCIYQSGFKPSSGSSVMIDLRSGSETWRSNAKVRAVSAAASEPGSFRVTLELERAHSAVIEDTDEDPVPNARAAATESSVSREARPKTQETPASESSPAPAQAPASGKSRAGSLADDSIKSAPAPTPAARAAVADVVRSVVASEVDQWKREVQSAVAGQMDAALRQSLDTIEAKIEGHFQKRPNLTEESVRKIAAQAAETAQIEWAATSRKIVAEAVRSAGASDGDRQRRELRALVTNEIEAALGGPFADRLDAKAEKAVNAGFEEYSRKRPALTEDTVRQLAAQVAESMQLEWASTKLQKIIAEAVRSSLTSEGERRRTEITAAVSAEIETAVQGPIAARLDAMIEKTLDARIAQHFQTPEAIHALQTSVAEAVHQPLENEYEKRGRQVQAAVSSGIEAAVRGPIASQMDDMLKKALDAQRAEYLRTPPAITEEALRHIVDNIARHPQLQDSIDALTANLSDRWAEIAREATAGAQQDINSRIVATERLANQVVLEIQQRLDSFSAEMNRILGSQGSPGPSDGDSPPKEELEPDKRFRELLQSTGSHFEREIKAALKKVFDRS